MKKFVVTYFDTAGEKRIRSFVIPAIAVYLFVSLFLCFIGIFVFAVYVSFPYQNKITADEVHYPAQKVEKAELSEYSAQLDGVIDFLLRNETFFKELFDLPCVSSHYQYSEFSSSFSSAKRFKDIWDVQNSGDYLELGNLMHLTDMLNAEIDKRREEHLTMIVHLEEQNVIFAHTPGIWPSTGHVTSRFGFRRSPFTGRPTFHEGVDLAASTGTPIKAAADGIIVFAGVRTGYGYLVTIDHGFGYITRYAHNSKLLVQSGDFVKKGDTISLSGSTGRSAGPHLHYEVLYNGTPIDAMKFLPMATP